MSQLVSQLVSKSMWLKWRKVYRLLGHHTVINRIRRRDRGTKCLALTVVTARYYCTTELALVLEYETTVFSCHLNTDSVCSNGTVRYLRQNRKLQNTMMQHSIAVIMSSVRQIGCVQKYKLMTHVKLAILDIIGITRDSVVLPISHLHSSSEL